MSIEHNKILSSTGGLGTQERTDGRLYTNGDFSDSASEIKGIFESGIARLRQEPEMLSRVVFRALISQQAQADILADPKLRDSVEVLVPVDAEQSLLYLGHNAPERIGGPPIADLVEATSLYPQSELTLSDHVEQAIELGYSWTNDIAPSDQEAILKLWGETFGWDEGQITNLQTSLDAAQHEQPSVREVWGSFARLSTGQIVGGAMGELLSLPGKNGPVRVVESTEWSVLPEFQRRNNKKAPRLMVGTLAVLHAQIREDLGQQPSVIYAECNLRSRADRAGSMAGLDVPNRHVAEHVIPQIVRHNVAVQDGLGQPGDPLPNFLFMHLSPAAHSAEQNKTILATAGIER